MIRVGFPNLGVDGWMGGIVYLSNLLFALSSLETKRIEPVVFLGRRSDPKVVAIYEPLAEIVFSSLMDPKSFLWTVHKVQRRVFNSDQLLPKFLKRHNVDLISHYSCRRRIAGGFGAISWIPDFQHLHLPDMFTPDDLARSDSTYRSQIENSDLVIVSSHDALKDLRSFAPEHGAKARVLHFVAQPGPFAYQERNLSEIEAKYGFSGKFFYLPNQFWKHKNHRTVFEAIRILKDRGQSVLVICSGQMKDWRNAGHTQELKDYIKQHSLERNIRLLGLISFQDLSFLMRNSISVINPSFFEGWSTTVEEAKSIGKHLILSDIPVHREQAPSSCCYFDPKDPEALAAAFADRWSESQGGPDYELEAVARTSLVERTVRFAHDYEEIALEALGIKKKANP